MRECDSIPPLTAVIGCWCMGNKVRNTGVLRSHVFREPIGHVRKEEC